MDNQMNIGFLQAVAKLETQDGAKSIKGPNGEDSNNLFNIKARTGQGFTAFDKAEGSHDAYRTYPDREASIQDFVGLLSRKYPEAHAALTQGGTPEQFAQGMAKGGYATDKNYAQKLVSVIQSTTPATKAAVSDAVYSGQGAMGALSALRQNGWSADIDEALKQGWKAEDIVQRIAGADYSMAQAAKASRDGRGIIDNAIDKTVDAGQGISLAARQMKAGLTGDTAGTEALSKEYAQRQASPDRAALNATGTARTLGAVGEVAPYAAAALIPGGIPTMMAANAAVGAGEAAFTPAASNADRMKSMVADGLMAGGTAGAVGLAGSGVSAVAGKLLARDPALVAERTALAERLREQGLPVNSMALTDTGKNIARRLPDNRFVAEARSAADDALSAKIAEGLGMPATKGMPIDTELISAARGAIGKDYEKALNFDFTIRPTTKGYLTRLIDDGKNPLTASIRQDATLQAVLTDVRNAAEAGATVPAKKVQDLVSELKALTQSQTASNADKAMAGKLVGHFQDEFTKAMTPEMKALYTSANQRWSNLKAVERMVALSNDSGTVLPRQILQSVKSGRFKNQFMAGDAPYQELGKTAAEAYGPANGRGLGDVLGRTVAGANDGLIGTAGLFNPVGAGAAFIGKKIIEHGATKAYASTNPMIVKLLTGVGGKGGMSEAQKQFIAKALGSTGAAIAQ